MDHSQQDLLDVMIEAMRAGPQDVQDMPWKEIVTHDYLTHRALCQAGQEQSASLIAKFLSRLRSRHSADVIGHCCHRRREPGVTACYSYDQRPEMRFVTYFVTPLESAPHVLYGESLLQKLYHWLGDFQRRFGPGGNGLVTTIPTFLENLDVSEPLTTDQLRSSLGAEGADVPIVRFTREGGFSEN